tara:strand:+ start:360 stop:716 length:357 start_codon:yes stop_codon:yes gene_type:complete
MALPWVDFVWTIQKWLSLNPTDAIANLPVSTKTAAYTVTATDYYLVANSASPITFTMPAASSNANRVFVFKNIGAGALTLNASGLGSIFTTASVTTLAVTTGNWAELTSNGTTWLART